MIKYPRVFFQCDDKYVWTNLTSLLKSGALDLETNDVIQKLQYSYVNISKTGNEQRPVFGVRELDESHFILDTDKNKQNENEMINFIPSSEGEGNTTQASKLSLHNSSIKGKLPESADKGNSSRSPNEVYVPLSEIPKGNL